jgi:CRISPR-associated protein Cas2
MWIMVMFDLPTDTKAARSAHARFRTELKRDGFMMIQYSVYARHCASEENTDVHIGRVERIIPDDGEVRVLTLTEKQYERMHIFWGKLRRRAERPPEQLRLF